MPYIHNKMKKETLKYILNLVKKKIQSKRISCQNLLDNETKRLLQEPHLRTITVYQKPQSVKIFLPTLTKKNHDTF